MSALISIRDVTKRYTRGKQQVEVLHGINLDIPKGDFVALMGPSGSGKTTLLNLIGGLDQPSTGSISIDGKRIDSRGTGELAKWRASATTALAAPEEQRASPQATRHDRKRIKELERELLRKDRALAETAALLVLSKKVQAIFNKGEDE